MCVSVAYMCNLLVCRSFGVNWIKVSVSWNEVICSGIMTSVGAEGAGYGWIDLTIMVIWRNQFTMLKYIIIIVAVVVVVVFVCKWSKLLEKWSLESKDYCIETFFARSSSWFFFCLGFSLFHNFKSMCTIAATTILRFSRLLLLLHTSSECPHQCTPECITHKSLERTGLRAGNSGPRTARTALQLWWTMWKWWDTFDRRPSQQTSNHGRYHYRHPLAWANQFGRRTRDTECVTIVANGSTACGAYPTEYTACREIPGTYLVGDVAQLFQNHRQFVFGRA